MKSTIDWNEIISKLPKKRRDDLYLEAVTILSENEPEPEPEEKVKKRRKRPQKIREWRNQSDGQNLADASRRFTINKNRANPFKKDSKGWKLWEMVKESKNDVITTAGVQSIGVGAGLRIADSVWMLWSRYMIDIAI